MKDNKIIIKTKNLLWKYENILKEIIAQRKCYKTDSNFWTVWVKYAVIVNRLQRNLLIY